MVEVLTKLNNILRYSLLVMSDSGMLLELGSSHFQGDNVSSL